jgi:uncharacterized protein (DUF952 family)
VYFEVNNRQIASQYRKEATMLEHHLLHVAIVDDWESAHRFGEYEGSTRGLTLDEVGYIHATTERGLQAVLDGVYGDLDLPLLVVVIDGYALRARGVDVVPDHPTVNPVTSWQIQGPLPMDSDVILAEVPLLRIAGHWAVPDSTPL